MTEQTVAGAGAGEAGFDDPEYMETLEQTNLAPLWDRYHKLVRQQPQTSEPSIMWRWRTVLPLLERAARDVPMEQAERRVLMLVNPAFDGEAAATTNLFAGLQILLPGEEAQPHRHTASALRLIIESEGAATIVNGKRCEMRRGDLVLTPNWTWHGHINDTDQRVIWLDGLDLPLSRYLDAIFAEGGPANVAPDDLSTLPDALFAVGGLMPDTERVQPPHSPQFRYPWSETVKVLEAMTPADDGTRRLRFTNPLDGGPVMVTLDCAAWQLDKGKASRPSRSTANAICCVLEGEGESTIGEVRHAWHENDVFTVPHWQWASHKATSKRARLFFVSDRDVLRRLSLLREEVQG